MEKPQSGMRPCCVNKYEDILSVLKGLQSKAQSLKNGILKVKALKS